MTATSTEPVEKRVDTLHRAAALMRDRAIAGLPDESVPPRVDIQVQGTCDGCAESKLLVASYPDGEHEPWLCTPCAAYVDHVASWTQEVALAVADMLEEFARLDDQGIHPPTAVVTLAKRYLEGGAS